MKKEVIINRSKMPTLFILTVALCFLYFAILDFVNNNIIRGAAFLILILFFALLFRIQPNRNQALIKISEQGLWTRNRGTKSWKSILVIKFRYENGQWFMDIYVSNDIVADEEISLHQVDMTIWWLKRLLKKYTRVEYH